MIEKMKICIDGNETEINTVEIAENIIAQLDDIIKDNINEALAAMDESNEKQMLSMVLFKNVKENVIISKEGSDLVIGFNSKYLIDALKVIDDEEINILFNSSVSPCLIKPLSGNEYEYLVLPVRITNN